MNGFNAGLLLAGLLLLALAWGPLYKLTFAWEMETLTIRQKWNPPADRRQSSQLSLVNVDARTWGNPVMLKLFQSAFTRPAAGYAVRFFNRAHPKMVIFDMGFTGGIHQDDLAGDHLFASSIQSVPSVASALVFEDEATPTALSPAAVKRVETYAVNVSGLAHFPVYAEQFQHSSLRLPYPELFASPMRFLAANSAVFKTSFSADDASGVSRRWTPFVLYQGKVYPSMALGVLTQGKTPLSLSSQGQLSWLGGSLNLGVDGLPLVKWYGHNVGLKHPVYPETSFSDVVLSELALECRENPANAFCKEPGLPTRPVVDPAVFNGRYILLGFTYANSPDEQTTIYGSKYPGVYIQANTLDNALNNDFVLPAPAWLNWLLGLGLPLLLAAIILRFHSTVISVLGLASLGLIHFLACLEAYWHWNLWVYCIYPLLSLAACFTGMYVYRYGREHRRRQQMRYAFGKYVSPAVLQIIEQHPEQVTLGGERREMTFLFSDIRGFTPFSDQNSPEVVQSVLTQYFSVMNGIIMHQYQGSINKLIGDAIMAYWGFPLKGEDHAFLAVSAALAMQAAMDQWREDEGKQPLYIGVGIHTGEAMVGNVGSEDFMDFTVIGDAVNVASRLESVTKTYGSKIIISAATYEKVKDRISARSLGWASLKGKIDQIEIYEPIGFL